MDAASSSAGPAGPDIGLAGLQLAGPDGAIQHAGVIVGSAASPTTSSRACARAATRSTVPPPGTATCSPSPAPASPSSGRRSTQLGGFDERFVLCGSDVALGLGSVLAGTAQHLLPARRGATPGVGDPGDERPDRRTSSPATGATTPGCSAGTRTGIPTSRLRSRRPALQRPARADARRSGYRSRSAAASTAFRQRNDAAESRHARRHVPGDRRRTSPANAGPARGAPASRSRCAPSTGTSRTSTAPSTAASTPRCGSPTTSPGPTACGTASSCGAARRTTSSARPWPRRSPPSPTAEIVFYDGSQRACARCPRPTWPSRRCG